MDPTTANFLSAWNGECLPLLFVGFTALVTLLLGIVMLVAVASRAIRES